MGQWDLMLSLALESVFYYVSLVPPIFLSLNLPLPSLFTPFPGLPLFNQTIYFLQGYREESKSTTAAEPFGRSVQSFSLLL